MKTMLKRLLMTVILAATLSAVFAMSLREQDDYTYIVRLYEMGDIEEVMAEIEYFRLTYPNSEKMPYLLYINANIWLNEARWEEAAQMYQELMTVPLQTEIKADVYLNYAICLYSMGDVQSALSMLLELGRFTEHPYYQYQGNLWRGKCYRDMGQLLSAEHEYKKAMAIDDNDKEMKYDYFKLLILLQREDEAFQIMDRMADDEYGPNYRLHWLKHLLYDQRFLEMDEFLAQIEDPQELESEPIKLLLLRKNLTLNNLHEAQALLDEMPQSSHSSYYGALLHLKQGEVAEADSLFRILVKEADPEIQVLSYLEHLKILYASDPARAYKLLQDYMNAPLPSQFRGQQHILMASFAAQEGDYEKALSLWAEARRFELSPELLDDVEISIADAYYQINQHYLAQEHYNRYLNTYQNGRYRDRAFYWLGMLMFEAKDYAGAKQNLKALLDRYPDSMYREDALFYYGELEFMSGNFQSALDSFQAIALSHDHSYSILLRQAQSLYYLNRFTEVQILLAELANYPPNFETLILEASVSFNNKDFAHALSLYQQAEEHAASAAQRQECTSYQAYTLYFLKRFDEASQLFLSLSQLNPDVDSYLFQAGRAAYQGGSYHRALELYERFLEDYPESDHFLSVLAQVALCNYNLGDYNQSFSDWLNILVRFRNTTSFTPEEVSLLRDAFTGLQLCLDNMDDISPIADLLGLADTFESEYIRFEINYLIIQLYASLGHWDQVLEEAEELRRSYPEQKRPELDLLMAESLFQLNQQKEAEELASQVFEETQSPESLLSLAKLAHSTGDLDIAQEKYLLLYEIQPSAANWLALLDVAQENDFKDYDEIWDLGKEMAMDHPQARINRIVYLNQNELFDEASMMANQILDTQSNQYIRAQADYELARMHYLKEDYARAISSFKRVRVLYREYPLILNGAQYHYILSLIHTGALKEAQLTLWEVQSILTDDQVMNINNLLDDER